MGRIASKGNAAKWNTLLTCPGWVWTQRLEVCSQLHYQLGHGDVQDPHCKDDPVNSKIIYFFWHFMSHIVFMQAIILLVTIKVLIAACLSLTSDLHVIQLWFKIVFVEVKQEIWITSATLKILLFSLELLFCHPDNLNSQIPRLSWAGVYISCFPVTADLAGDRCLTTTSKSGKPYQ